MFGTLNDTMRRDDAVTCADMHDTHNGGGGAAVGLARQVAS